MLPSLSGCIAGKPLAAPANPGPPACRVYAGAFGGLIAAFRDDRKVVLYVGSLTKPDIQLFTAAGTALGRVLWDKGRIVGVGWSPQEHLIVVDDRGQVRAASRW